ncbi:MAG TPA: hypothetical protein VNO50_17315 [Pyrinomonadaceae bacterium]|nr:hypothetical protein [Pyrinomonadaceae bacterium]
MRWFLFSLLCGFMVSAGYLQESNAQDRHRFVVVPSDQGLALIAPQPDSPLRFEDVKLVANVATGLWSPSFRLRNRGTKPIRAFTVAAAGSGEWGLEPDSGPHVMPGQIAPLYEDSRDKIVPLTEELRDKLKLRGSMKNVLVLVVVRVEYADGTRFQEPAFEGLKYYFEKIYAGCAKE